MLRPRPCGQRVICRGAAMLRPVRRQLPVLARRPAAKLISSSPAETCTRCPRLMSQEQSCRHEYVKIIQRRLKGLERRLVATRAYLPIGFKPTDLSHLGEGSYCFCTKCRARLFPRRTQAEKAAARLALAIAKEKGDAPVESAVDAGTDVAFDTEPKKAIDVEELELESVDMQDIEAEGVKLADDETSCQLADDE